MPKEEFQLKIDTLNPNWVDVIYPEGPKYMISISAWSCTCTGDTIGKALKKKGINREDCKHLKELAKTIKIT